MGLRTPISVKTDTRSEKFVPYRAFTTRYNPLVGGYSLKYYIYGLAE